MSLILDALRKSEAERRRGQSPSLYAQLPAPAARLRPEWLPWIPIALLVLAVVAVAVWYARSGDKPVTKEELVEDSNKSLLPPSPDAVVAKDPAAAAPSPVLASAPMAAPPNAAAATVPGAVAPVKPKTPNVDALVQPSSNGVQAPANATVTSLPMPPAATPAPAATEEAVPPVAVLDPSTRGALPPMKMSMLVYNADPAQRFAIVDGQRVAEGAQIGSAIVLEIRRDGVLLDVAGRRVLLPRP
jgi:general secretion pathway protein B